MVRFYLFKVLTNLLFKYSTFPGISGALNFESNINQR